MRIRALAFLALIAFAVPAAGSPSAQAQAQTPEAVVARWTDFLIEVMKEAKALGFKGRYERLLPVVEETFHLPTMVRFAAGAYWTDSSPEQRNRLVLAFTRLNVGTLATFIDDYSGESFRFKGPMPGPQGTTLFRTELVKANGSTIDIAYLMANFKSGWRAFDVVVDNGISELNVRRSEYNRILAREGLEGLIAALNSKADELTISVANAQ